MINRRLRIDPDRTLDQRFTFVRPPELQRYHAKQMECVRVVWRLGHNTPIECFGLQQLPALMQVNGLIKQNSDGGVHFPSSNRLPGFCCLRAAM